MKCITYGTVVLLMIIISYIYGKIYSNGVDFSDPVAAEQAMTNVLRGGGVVGLIGLGLTLWWLLGLMNDCTDGYFLNPRLKKTPESK